MKSPAAVKSVEPVTDMGTLPIILTIRDISRLYRVSQSTIRRGVQAGTFSPVPWERYPYRWRRADVIVDLQKPRDERPRSAHGRFPASRARRQAKATIETTKATRSNAR